MSDPQNFYLYVDREGKMPVLRKRPTVICARPSRVCTHPYFVRYVGNAPVEVNPYPGQVQVWDYAASCAESLCIVKDEDEPDEKRLFVGTYDMCASWVRRAQTYTVGMGGLCIKNLKTGRLMSY